MIVVFVLSHITDTTFSYSFLESFVFFCLEGVLETAEMLTLYELCLMWKRQISRGCNLTTMKVLVIPDNVILAVLGLTGSFI